MTLLVGCGPDKGGKDVYYCPMHPTYTSDRPGDCPICNMKLVKKESPVASRQSPVEKKSTAAKEHKDHEMAPAPTPAKEKTFEEVCVEHSCTMNNCPMRVKATIKPGERVLCPICGEVITTASGKVVEIAGKKARSIGPTVMISPEKQQLIGVTTGAVAKRALTKTLRASGRIAYDPELAITQEEYIQALNNEERLSDSPLQDVIDRAKNLTSAARKKLALLGMSEDEIERLKITRRPETSLYLPGKGENVWAYISIYEYEIGLVKSGLAVEIEPVAYPGEIFSGTVMSINPVLDPTTRTNQVRVEVANPDGKLKPEMFVNARIRADIGEVLAVPDSAVLDTGVRKIVYLSREDDMLESRDVVLGQKGDGKTIQPSVGNIPRSLTEGYYEVRDGLEEGDIVVTSGNFLIDSESRMKASAAGAQEHQH